MAHRTESHRTTSLEKRPALIQRSEIIPLFNPDDPKRPFIMVRVRIEKGMLYIQSQERRLSLISKGARLKAEYDLKVIWVNDMLDDESGGMRNCFVVMAPEKSYILQAESHRAKIEWIQTTAIAISQALRFRGSYRPSAWKRLDDLQRWLGTREVDYTFQNGSERYKGAVYTGKWTAAMPHTCGTMKWPNGDVYKGEFDYGKFQGTGTMVWASDKQYRSYVGSWQGGAIEGHGEMTYVNRDMYTGWWHSGKRHGHGRMEYKGTHSVYIGAWKDDLRCGYGVFEDGQRHEKYIGMWSNDKYNGPGILITSQQTLYTCNFENGSMKSLNELASIPHDLKWDPLFQCSVIWLERQATFRTPPGGPAGTATPQERLHKLLQHTHSCPLLDDEPFESDEEDFEEGEEGDMTTSPVLERVCEKCHSYMGMEEECVSCKVQSWKATTHPIGMLIDYLTKCFVETYNGLGTHKYLLPYATAELNSLVFRLHETIRKYCPEVVTCDDSAHMSPARRISLLAPMPRHKLVRRAVSNNIAGKGEGGQLDPSWLYPVLLPHLYPTLFLMYRENHADEDRKLDSILDRFGTKTEEELARLFDIHSEYELWTTLREKSSGGFGSVFADAVVCFQKIGACATPIEKLLCVRTVCEEIAKVKEKFSGGGKDDVNPTTPPGMLAFVVIKARVHYLESERSYIHDFTGKTFLTSKYSYLLTLLQNCFDLMKSISIHSVSG